MYNFKKVLNFLPIIALVIFTGCSEDFLDKEPSENYLSGKQVKEISKLDPSVTQSVLTGIYGYMSKAGVGGTRSDEDFGQKGNDIISDILSCDMAYKNAYNRYGRIANLTAMENYRITVPHYMFWRYYYRVIYQANAVIAVYEGKTDLKGKEKWILGQAKAMRAYGYLYLAMYYTPEYKPSEKVLVLYTKQETEAKPQVTTKEIMDLVIKDLNEAITSLEDFKRGDKSMVNKYVAEGLLAYAYGYMGQYDKVIPLASDIITKGGFTLTPKGRLYDGMNNINKESGWMWGTDIIPDMKLGLVSFWGQVDYFSYSYAAYGGYKMMDNVLYSKMNSKDLRKGQFESSVLIPWKKFYAPERQPRGAKRIIEEDYVYMRVEEFYLLKAEAEAKLNQDANAISSLKPLLAQRYEADADYAYITSMTGQDLEDEIYLQTRLELWGEGKSYFAMKRNKSTVTRGTNGTHLPKTSYKYNDPKLTFKIPLDEVENNIHVKN